MQRFILSKREETVFYGSDISDGRDDHNLTDIDTIDADTIEEAKAIALARYGKREDLFLTVDLKSPRSIAIGIKITK